MPYKNMASFLRENFIRQKYIRTSDNYIPCVLPDKDCLHTKLENYNKEANKIRNRPLKFKDLPDKLVSRERINQRFSEENFAKLTYNPEQDCLREKEIKKQRIEKYKIILGKTFDWLKAKHSVKGQRKIKFDFYEIKFNTLHTQLNPLDLLYDQMIEKYEPLSNALPEEDSFTFIIEKETL